MKIIYRLKVNGKTYAYIKKANNGKYRVCTGKPSDTNCLSWLCDTYGEAQEVLKSYNEAGYQMGFLNA